MYDYNVWRARPGRGVAVTDKANHWYEVYCGVRVLAVKTNQVGQKEKPRPEFAGSADLHRHIC